MDEENGLHVDDAADVSAATQDLSEIATASDYSGTVLGGYRLTRRVAEGGMGVVYEAIQLNLSRKVAVKILNEQLAGRPEFMLRFEREAKAAAALNHPNMVQVHDFGHSDGCAFLVMEYVEGADLDNYLEQNGKFSIHAALEIIEQAAVALQAAAEKSIIHRDVKPSNLMLTADGRLKLSDLGLAKILNEASDLTLTGMGMGSPYFMAPEQASDASDVDHRADIYSLGLTLLFLLTGKRPYEGATPFSIVLAHANKPLPTGRDLGTKLPSEIEALVQKMAAKNPAERYQDYPTLLADLRRVKAGHRPALDFAAMRRKYLSKAIVAAVTAVVVFTAFTVFSNRTKSKKAPEPGAAAAIPAHGREMFDEAPARPGPKGNNPDEFGGPPPFENAEGPENRRFEGPPSARQSGIPFPLARLPRPAGSSIPEGPVSEMLAQADKYAAANATNYRDQVDRYRQVLSKASGTPHEAVVNEKLNHVIDQHQQALRKTIQEYQSKMDAKLFKHDAQAAYDVWKDFPQNLRTFESDQQISQLLQRKLPPDFMPDR